ncbi:MAG TPA: zinc ribbon domain-containing protein [Candidatus Lokiarchaeia archaeon]|nr:zinc ribbon domain-containing protein [Candidatus Lokiarchaeia archaeon]
MPIDIPPVILANWDEMEGPIIVKALFPAELAGTSHTPEILISRCYISAESIFAKEKFTKINFSLPLIALKKLAIVFFDMLNESAEKNEVFPFLLVIFVPIDTVYAMMESILKIVEPCIEQYKSGQFPELESMQMEIGQVLESKTAGPSTDASQENLKQEFLKIAKDRLDKMMSDGITLRVINCPACGNQIFPDELACTRCRLIVRTFCTQCNAIIERSLKFCTKCGLANPRFDPAIWLVTNLEENQRNENQGSLDSNETGIRDEPRVLSINLGEQKTRAVMKGLDHDMDSALLSMAKEIEELKEDLEIQVIPDQSSETNLLDAFMHERSSKNDDVDNSMSRFREIMLKNPSSSDAIRLINRLENKVNEDSATLLPETLLLSWDCDAFVHAAGRILVGRGSKLDDADGVPGILFITETALIFISYVEIVRNSSRVFSYFDAGLQHVRSCSTFSQNIKNNSVEFKNHGMCAKKFPLEHSLYVNFSWQAEEQENPWINQAINLRSMLMHQKQYPKKPPAPAGMFFQFFGKTSHDNAIKNVLASLQLNFPQVLKIVKEKYPVLF